MCSIVPQMLPVGVESSAEVKGLKESALLAIRVATGAMFQGYLDFYLELMRMGRIKPLLASSQEDSSDLERYVWIFFYIS